VEAEFSSLCDLPADSLGFGTCSAEPPQKNIPKHVLNNSSLPLDTDVAMLAMESPTQ
jgi:hypothetical protein